MLTGGVAGLLAGIVEAAQLQLAGLGAHGTVASIEFITTSGLLAVPAGILVGVAASVGLALLPPPRIVALRRYLSAPLVYSAGAVMPFVLASSFHFFLWMSGHFRNLSLMALVAALFTCALFVMASALAVVVSILARAMMRRFPPLGNSLVAGLVVVASWLVVSLPGWLGGPDQATRGVFGFVGLLRKDTLDYSPLVTLGALLLGFTSARVVSGWDPLKKALVSVMVALAAAGSIVVAGGDAVRPLILEHGMLTRVTLRGLQMAGDWDGDGYSRWLGGGDCDDGNPRIHPGAKEIPGNGIDEDCDGEDLQPEKAVGPTERASLVRPKVPDQLSFLFLTVDALRPDLGYMGYERDVSPRIDELARQSVIYERAYSISTYTGFCLPPMMASRYPSEMPRTSRHEVQYLRSNVLLAERMHEGGFRTEGGASHFLFAPELGWVDGFEHFFSGPLEGNAPPGSHVDLFHSSRGLADATISLLSNHEVTSGRFFIWVHFLDPHKQYLEHPGFSQFGQKPRDLYDGEIAFTDFHIGRVLDALAALHLSSRTVVILTGDHGEAFGEHGEYFHGGDVWDEIVRVPLIIHFPGATPRRIARRVSDIDLAPTVLDLADLPADPGAHGESLAPELFGGTLPSRPILIDQPRNTYYRPKRAFIDGGMKLHHLIDANSFLLYDLERDPHETQDLATEDPAALKRMRHAYAQLVARLTEVDPIPSGEVIADP